MTKELEEVLEWYTLIMKLVLKADGLLTVYFNKFVSKKDENSNEIINHISGLSLLKSNEMLKVSKDQLLLMTFLKNIVEETIKDTDTFSYQY